MYSYIYVVYYVLVLRTLIRIILAVQKKFTNIIKH